MDAPPIQYARTEDGVNIASETRMRLARDAQVVQAGATERTVVSPDLRRGGARFRCARGDS